MENRILTSKVKNSGRQPELLSLWSFPLFWSDVSVLSLLLNLFQQLTEYGALRGIGSYGAGSGTNAAGEVSFSNPSRFSSQTALPSGQPTSSGLLAPISEFGAKSIEERRRGDESFGKGHKSDESYMAGFALPSWDDSQILTDDFLQVPEDDESGSFSNVNASDNQVFFL